MACVSRILSAFRRSNYDTVASFAHNCEWFGVERGRKLVQSTLRSNERLHTAWLFLCSHHRGPVFPSQNNYQPGTLVVFPRIFRLNNNSAGVFLVAGCAQWHDTLFQDRIILAFHFAVRLRPLICYSYIFYAVLLTEITKLMRTELGTIVGFECHRKSMMAKDFLKGVIDFIRGSGTQYLVLVVSAVVIY